MNATTATTTGAGKTAARYSIEFGSIAALQNITAPNGEKFCAIYENANSFLFCGERNQQDLSALLPENVKQCALERFRFIFALPYEQRGQAIATLPASLI